MSGQQSARRDLSERKRTERDLVRLNELETLVGQRTVELHKTVDALAAQRQRFQGTGQLKAAHAQLQAVFDVVNVGMLLVAEDGSVKRVNNTISRWVGRELPDSADSQPGDFVGCIHAVADPAGCGRTPHCASCDIRNAFQSVLRTGQPVHDLETEAILAIDATGAHLWLEVSADPLTIDGKRHVILALNNVTARKHAEEALRESQKDLNRAQAVAQTGSWRLDVRNNTLRWSDEAHRIFGIPAGTPLTYETFLNAVYPDDRAEVDRQWRAALKGEAYDVQHRIVAGDDVKWVRERAELEFDSRQTLLGGFGTTQDITDRKQTEEALRRTAAELTRSNEDLARFAYVASHDLQEPLRVVASFLQLLERKHADRLDAEAREYIERAVDGAKRMQTLIDDLLAYSRVGARGHQPAPTDSGAAFRQALQNLHVGIVETAAEITPGKLPTVRADGAQLTQLFQNLIGNALKFHGPQPPAIRVEARRKNDHWLFSVRDNGIGIAPEFQNRIFQIFQRLHTRRQYPGTGIGLAICKRIVERHGGQIGVESQPGQGAMFYFTLPA